MTTATPDDIVVEELPWRVVVREVGKLEQFVSLLHRDNATLIGSRGADGQPIGWTRHRETTKDNVLVIEASDGCTYRVLPQFWAHPKDWPPK